MTAARRSMLLMVVFLSLWTVVELIAAGVLARVSPYQLVWTRYVVHLAALVLVFALRDPGRLWRTRRPLFQLARSMMMLGMPAAWVMSRSAGVSENTLMTVFWLSPLLVLAIARMALGEVARPSVWMAGIAGWIGVCLVFWHARLPGHPAALLLPLMMALSFSCYIVMTRSLRSEGTAANLFYSALGVALVLTPFMPGLWTWPTTSDLLVMVGVGVFGLLGLLALDRMAAAAPVSFTAPLIYLQVPLAVAIFAAMTRDLPGARVVAGVLLVIGAAAGAWLLASPLTVREKGRPAQQAAVERLSRV